MVHSLLTVGDVRRIVEELDFHPTKQRGQNFVVDGNTIRRIVAQTQITSDDTVLEVGPGLGSLTLGLLDVAQAVVAIEIDPILAARLPQTVREFRPDRLEALHLVTADALRVHELDAPQPTILVANLPYNVAVPILLHLMATFPTLEHGVVMVQEEVADRLVAAPGSKSYGIPSAKMAWYGQMSKAGTVGNGVFWPVPRVSSGIVTFVRQKILGAFPEREEVFAVVDAAFAQRRKTLRAALTGWAGSAAQAEAYTRAAGIAPQSRGENLHIHDFVRIAQAKAARLRASSLVGLTSAGLGEKP